MIKSKPAKEKKLTPKEMDLEIKSMVDTYYQNIKFYEADDYDYYEWLSLPLTDNDETLNIVTGFPYQTESKSHAREKEQINGFLFRARDAGEIKFKDFSYQAMFDGKTETVDYFKFKPLEITKYLLGKEFFNLPPKLVDAYNNIIANQSKRPSATSNLETKCHKWLIQHTEKGNPKAPKLSKTGISYYHAAIELFPGLAKRQFLRAWNQAVKDHPAWSKAGNKIASINSISELMH